MIPQYLKKLYYVLIPLAVTILAIVSSLELQRSYPIVKGEDGVESNLGFVVLINLNIIAVMILGFMVIRNIVKLILDRRRNILGARLKTRLVLAFMLLSLVPTTLLFLAAKGMVEGVFQDWFSPKVEMALNSSKLVAKNYFEVLEKDNLNYSASLSKHLIKIIPNNIKNNNDSIADFIKKHEDLVVEKEMSVSIFRPDLELILTIGESLSIDDPLFNLEKIKEVFQNKIPISSPERIGDREFLRIYSYVDLGNNPLVMVTTKQVQLSMTQALSTILTAADEYRNFKSYRKPLDSGFFSSLIVVTLLIVFAAISVGFFIARGLTVPIGLLAKGTEQVAHGNLNFHIPEFGDDELTILVRSFNKMTSDLKETTGELIARRTYIETILANVGVGVLSLSSNGEVTTVNNSTFEILDMDSTSNVLRSNFKETFPEQFVQLVEEIKSRSLRGKSDQVAKIRIYNGKNGTKNLQIVITKMVEDTKKVDLGLVILVDDLTEIDKAQRMIAWQEVAKRMAHEIKNPLTPIRLSAERILRMKNKSTKINGESSFSLEEQDLINETTSVIMQQVEHLRILVNEFSEFARLPKSELLPGSITPIISRVIDTYSTTHPDIIFEFVCGNIIPEVLFDSHQIERVLINLIDNSIFSLQSLTQPVKKIIVSIGVNSSINNIILEIIDNGIGVSDVDKRRLFEPYFSTKSSGTGLGLAIVKSVVSDHNGFIRVSDTPGGGLTVRIELPTLT